MNRTLSFTAAALFAPPAAAASLTVTVEIPRLTVAEYHRPYVALWVEDAAGKVAGNLGVWYQVDHPEGEGPKWLADLRTWWRRTGRSLTVPADGLTGPTRPPGTHTLTVANDSPPLGALAPGNYQLRVEAAREVGGRELVTIPFSWPLTAAKPLEANGSAELGRVTLAAGR
jgi:hypothetical protein